MKRMNSVLCITNLRCPWNRCTEDIRYMSMDFCFGLKNLHLRFINTNVEAEVVDEITQVNCAEMNGE